MSMSQVMVEFSAEDGQDIVDHTKIDIAVEALLGFANMLGIPPAKLREMGAKTIAEIAERQTGKPHSPARIRPILSQPEFR